MAYPALRSGGLNRKETTRGLPGGLYGNFYIADTHFGHENALELDCRPFADLAEMEAAMIQNWNSAVGDEDRVYILGDFVWDGPNHWLELLAKLRGKKVLIRGNHDLTKRQIRGPDAEETRAKILAQFETVADYLEIMDGGRHVTLCHYPILFYNGSHRPGNYMLCGHVHASRENDYLEACAQAVRADPRAGQGNIYNVGCMMLWMDYTPRTLDEIIEKKAAYDGENA